MGRPPAVSRLSSRWGTEVIEQAVRLALLAFLVYWSFLIVRPFVPILVWSVVLAVALYPGYTWLTMRLGGRSALAAVLLTCLSLVVVVGPAIWMSLSVIDSLKMVADDFSAGSILVPRPPETIRAWPLIGPQLYGFWHLASSNLADALQTLAPHLKSYARPVLDLAGSAGLGVLSFLASIVLAGFLLVPGPRLVVGVREILDHVVPRRSGEFVALAGSAIRTISRGVLGISLLQALLAGIGFKVAGIVAAGVLTFLVFAFGVIQIGPSLVILPAIGWAWMTMETGPAAAFTLYMLAVNFMDNILKPIVMGHGLRTPIPVIFIGVVGGTLAHGLIGLFVGPIVLAISWELLRTWTRSETEAAPLLAGDAGIDILPGPAPAHGPASVRSD